MAHNDTTLHKVAAAAAAAAAKSLQSCPTPCDPIDRSPPGSPVPGILQGKNTGVGCHFLLPGIFLTHNKEEPIYSLSLPDLSRKHKALVAMGSHLLPQASVRLSLMLR